MRRRTLAFLLGWFAAAGGAWAADDPPSWLREAASSALPNYSARTPAVVLLNENRIVVDETGRVSTFTRKAIKVLSRQGRSEANGYHIYSLGSAKVRDMRAWMMAPSGEMLAIKKENIYDRAFDAGNAYDDLRIHGVDAVSKADPGSVFGYESTIEETLPFAQFAWPFQDRLPALISRYTLTLPAGWHAESVTYNHAPLTAAAEGSTYTWELRNLPFIEPEASSPNLAAIAPRICVSYFPVNPGRSLAAARSFATWRDVSAWITGLSEPSAVPDSAITAKAKTIVAAATTEFQRIQLIGLYVQASLRYVSIQTGTSHGGGYKPRAAAETFVKEYGDCKDKATLVRALLKAVGIDSYLVTVYSSDSNYVRQDWPSPQQFNHAIVAIKVSPETQAAAILVHPKLGRLLFFDPTNGTVPAGDLPLYEQGGLALVAAGDDGDLARLPLTPPSHNLWQREIRGAISEDGSLAATMHEEAHGQAAAADRGMLFSQQRPDYEKSIERFVTRAANGAAVSKVTPRDYFLQNRFDLDVAFQAAGYAQLKANRLLVFKPVTVGRREAVFLTEPSRTLPISLSPAAWRETAHFKLPAGFKLDEIPDPEKLETPFGHYSSTCEFKNGELVLTRELEIRSAIIPPAQYSAVHDFYARIVAVEQSPVVLLKQ